MLIDNVKKRYEADTLKYKYIEYNTNFIGLDGDCISYYLDVKTGTYTDFGFCIDELQCITDDWEEIANYYCKQNHCSLSDQELKATTDYQLLQTMLAIYTWIDTITEIGLKCLSQLNQDEDSKNKWQQVIDELARED